MNMEGQEFLEWYDTASEADIQLFEKVCGFEELFSDMLFQEESITKEFVSCQSLSKVNKWIDDTVVLPEDLEYFSYRFFTYHVSVLEKGVGGCFDEKAQTLTVIPKCVDNDAIILHEMIHLHEFVLNSMPLFYHDTLLWCLYRDLKGKIENLDDIVADHGHLLNEQSIYSQGGLHDILFLLKSFDLDLRKGYQLGTVFAYAGELYKKYRINEE